MTSDITAFFVPKYALHNNKCENCVAIASDAQLDGVNIKIIYVRRKITLAEMPYSDFPAIAMVVDKVYANFVVSIDVVNNLILMNENTLYLDSHMSKTPSWQTSDKWIPLMDSHGMDRRMDMEMTPLCENNMFSINLFEEIPVYKWMYPPTVDEVEAMTSQGMACYFMNMVFTMDMGSHLDIKDNKTTKKRVESFSNSMCVYRMNKPMVQLERIMQNYNYEWMNSLFYDMPKEKIKVKYEKEEITTIMSQITDKTILGQEFNLDLLGKYRYARHELILESVCREMGIHMQGDQELEIHYGKDALSHPDHMLTPDIVAHRNDMNQDFVERIDSYVDKFNPEKKGWNYLMSDVTVGWDPISEVVKKIAKYQSFCNKMSEKEELKTVMIFFGFDMNTGDSSYFGIFEELSIDTMAAMEMVRSRETELRALPMYNRLLGMATEDTMNFTWDDLDHLFNLKVSSAFGEAYHDFNLDQEIKEFELSDNMLEEVSMQLKTFVEEQSQQIRNLSKMKPEDANKFLRDNYMNHNEAEMENSLNKQRLELMERGMPAEQNDLSNSFKLCEYPVDRATKEEYQLLMEDDMQRKMWKFGKMDDGTMLSKRFKNKFKSSKRDEAGYQFKESLCTEAEEVFSAMAMKSSKKLPELEVFINKIKNMKLDRRTMMFFDSFMETEGANITMWFQTLAQEIMYMSGRRHIGNRNQGAMRCYDWGVLILGKGPKLTREKIVSFKILIKEDKQTSNSIGTHLFKDEVLDDGMNIKGFKETKWLSMNLADLEMFARCMDKALMIFTGMSSLNILETELASETMTVDIKRLMIPVAIMLSHKRNTSNNLQLNRYLYHSAISIMSNKPGIIKKIGEMPVRDSIGMWVVSRQLEWSRKYLVKYKDLQMNMAKMVREFRDTTKKDRIYMNSMIDDSLIEMEEVVNEMYLCNLFNKEHGHITHRSKMIFDKVCEDEVHMRNNRGNPWNKGEVVDMKAFLNSKQEYGFFHKKVVAAASNLMWKSLLDKFDVRKMARAMLESIYESMYMTSSVEEGRVDTFAGLKKGDKGNEKRTANKISMMKVAKERNTSKSFEMAMLATSFEIYFGTFPKAQIGGNREIMIQDMYSRVIIRLVEKIFTTFNESLPMEMITEGSKKHMMQANMFDNLSKADMNGYSKRMLLSNNTDQSHWAPSMNMLQMVYMVKGMGIGNNMKNFLMSVLSGFSNKIMALPPSLVKNWQQDKSYMEKKPELEMMRQESSKNNWTIRLLSGMGQGMLHATSSYYHCVEWYFCRHMMKVSSDLMRVSVNEYVQLSSDDKTEYKVVSYNSSVELYHYMYLDFYVRCIVDRCFNIHFNDKKSGMNCFLSEFNSVFMVGKRMISPFIKDLYTVVDIPDTSRPETAVRSLISNERRLMTNGAPYVNCTLARALNRNFLMDLYKLHEMESRLSESLDCNINELPFSLGFMSNSMIFESYVMGPEVYMVHASLEKKDKLVKHYSSIYGVISDIKKNMKSSLVTDGEVSTRMSINLRTMKEKRIEDLKKNIKMNLEETMSSIEKNPSLLLISPMSLKELEEKVAFDIHCNISTYEVFDRVRLDAMIRALSMSTKKAKISGYIPHTQSSVEYNNEENNLDKMWESIFPDGIGMEEFLIFTLRDDVKTVDLTKLFFFRTIEEVVVSHNKNVTRLMQYGNINMNLKTHRKMRKISFASNTVVTTPNVFTTLKFLCNPLYEANRATRISIALFFEAMGLDRNSTRDDIMMLFDEADRTELNFVRLIRSMTSYSYSSSTIMSCEFPDQGNAVANIYSLYKMRADYRGPLDLEMTEDILKGDKLYMLLHNTLVMTDKIEDFMEMSQNLDIIRESGVEFKILESTKGSWVNMQVMKGISNGYDPLDILSYFNRPMYFSLKTRRSDRTQVHMAYFMDTMLRIEKDKFNRISPQFITTNSDTREVEKHINILINYMNKEMSRPINMEGKHYSKSWEIAYKNHDLPVAVVNKIFDKAEWVLVHTKFLTKVQPEFLLCNKEVIRCDMVKEDNKLWNIKNAKYRHQSDPSKESMMMAIANNMSMEEKDMEMVLMSHPKFKLFKNIATWLEDADIMSVKNMNEYARGDRKHNNKRYTIKKDEMNDLKLFNMDFFGVSLTEMFTEKDEVEVNLEFGEVTLDNSTFLSFSEAVRKDNTLYEEELDEDWEEMNRMVAEAMKEHEELNNRLGLENMREMGNILDISNDKPLMDLEETFSKDNAYDMFFKICSQRMKNKLIFKPGGLSMQWKDCKKLADRVRKNDNKLTQTFFLSNVMGSLKTHLDTLDEEDTAFRSFIPAYVLHKATEITEISSLGMDTELFVCNMSAFTDMFTRTL